MKLTLFQEALVAFAIGYVVGSLLFVLPPRVLVVGAIVILLVLFFRTDGRKERSRR